MNLIGFHRILIGTAAAFFAGYGVWEGVRYIDGGDVLRLVLAVGAITASVLLLFYLRRLRRFLNLRD
jgi:hypothetical protein